MDFSQNASEELPSEPFRGINFFRYADRNIFAARNWEKEQLTNLVIQYRGCLLYGQSGVGKSSLINAGLIPQLIQNNFQAERIRIFPDNDNTFIVYLNPNSDKGGNYLPTLFEEFKGESKDEISVSFEDFKRVIFSQTYQNKADKIEDESDKPMPVLIFDQFEEFITLFEEVRPSNDSISLAFYEKKELQEKLVEFFRHCYYNKKLRIKMIFSFREDYLAKFSKLFQAIPDLRDHLLRVKAVSKDDIRKIIEYPFFNEGRKLHFESFLTNSQINSLESNLLKYFGENVANLTDIQIACQYLYKIDKNKRDREISKEEVLGNPVSVFIERYFKQLVDEIEGQDKLIAIDILALLVLNERTRNVLHQTAIIESLEKSNSGRSDDDIKRVLQLLEEKKRIVRCEIRSGGLYYEINSESIIPFINKTKIEKEQKTKFRKERRKAGLILSLVLIIASIFAGLFVSSSRKESKLNDEDDIRRKESKWYSKIPTDELRDSIVGLLYNSRYDSNTYSLLRNSFEMLAGTFHYLESHEYMKAISLSYLSLKSYSNSISKKVYDSCFKKAILPSNVIELKTTSTYAKIDEIFPAHDNHYFILFTDGSIRFYNSFDSSYSQFDVFKRSQTSKLNLNDIYLDEDNLEVKISSINIKNNFYYVFWNSVSLYLYDSDLNLCDSLKLKIKNPKINEIAPVGDKFKVFYNNSSSQVYTIDKNHLKPLNNNYKQTYIPKSIGVKNRFFTNSKYYNRIKFTFNDNYFIDDYFYRLKRFGIRDYSYLFVQSVFNIYDDDSININNNYILDDINLVEICLLRNKKNNHFYICKYADISDINKYREIGKYPTILAQSDSFFITFEMGKLLIKDFESFKVLNSIEDLPGNNEFTISPNGTKILIYQSSDNLLIYDRIKNKIKYIHFSSVDLNDETYFSEFNKQFINDSVLLISKKNKIYLYNVNRYALNIKESKYISDLYPFIFETKYYKKHKENTAKIVFMQKDTQFIKCLINKIYSEGEYDTAIKYIDKLLKINTVTSIQKYCFNKLEDCYNRLAAIIPEDSMGFAKKLPYLRLRSHYLTKLYKVSMDSISMSNMYTSYVDMTRYLFLSGNYKSAIDTVKIVIEGAQEDISDAYACFILSLYFQDGKKEEKVDSVFRILKRKSKLFINSKLYFLYASTNSLINDLPKDVFTENDKKYFERKLKPYKKDDYSNW